MKTKVLISPEVETSLKTPKDGCYHPSYLLVLVDETQIYCPGCNTWFGPVQVQRFSGFTGEEIVLVKS